MATALRLARAGARVRLLTADAEAADGVAIVDPGSLDEAVAWADWVVEAGAAARRRRWRGSTPARAPAGRARPW